MAAILLSLFFGWGYFIWSLCRPALGIWETIGFEAAAYGLIGFYLAWLSLPGAFCTKVKY